MGSMQDNMRQGLVALAGIWLMVWGYSRRDEVFERAALARRLALEEGILAGISSGANVCAALQVAADLGVGKTVVVIVADTEFSFLRMIGCLALIGLGFLITFMLGNVGGKGEKSKA